MSDRDHDLSLTDKPTVFVMSRPLKKKLLSSGIKAITHDDIRWQNCDIKAITLLPSVLLRHKAKQQGAAEALLLRDGKVTEGAASNIFICKQDQIVTPEKDNHVLPGITRDLLIEILKENNIDYVERMISAEELFAADEIWVTSSTWEIVPVVELDNKAISNGLPGPIWHKVNALYQKYKAGFQEG